MKINLRMNFKSRRKPPHLRKILAIPLHCSETFHPLNGEIVNHEITNFDMNPVSIITNFDMFLVISFDFGSNKKKKALDFV